LDNNLAPSVESILDESGSHFSNLWHVVRSAISL